MTTDSDQQPDTNPDGFRVTPFGHVYGIVDQPSRDVPAVTADLLAAKIPLDGIHVYCCTEGVTALDPSGTEHGLRARIIRMVQAITFSNDHLKIIGSELEAGHALIGIAVDEDRKSDVASILRDHGGHNIVHYGKFTWQRLSPQNQSKPVAEPEAL